MKVSVFIVGSPKSGTTSLYHYLDEHPSIIMSLEKEPNYSYVAARLLMGNIHKEVFGCSVDKDAFDHQYRLSFIRNIKSLVKEKMTVLKNIF